MTEAQSASDTGNETDAPAAPEWTRSDFPMSAEMLKALANPLRQKLVSLMRREKYVRAADAAAQLGEPANKISFHLRVLADAGLIEEAPEHARDRRDRVWTTRPGSWSLGDSENPVADEALGNTVLQLIGAEHIAMVQRALAWAPEFASGRDTQVHGAFTRTSAHLTEDEFNRLIVQFHEIIAEAKANHNAEAPDSRFFEIDIVAADDQI